MTNLNDDKKKGPRYSRMSYRPCVGVLLFNKDGLVFAGQRVDTKGEAWQLPQGGVDQDESPKDAAWRELKEETGVSNARLLAETVDWICYDLPEELRGKVWNGDFRGQKQKWYAMLFEGDDAEIQLDVHKPEFKAWAWKSLDELQNTIVPFKRGVYAELLRRFGPLAERIRQQEI